MRITLFLILSGAVVAGSVACSGGGGGDLADFVTQRESPGVTYESPGPSGGGASVETTTTPTQSAGGIDAGSKRDATSNVPEASIDLPDTSTARDSGGGFDSSTGVDSGPPVTCDDLSNNCCVNLSGSDATQCNTIVDQANDSNCNLLYKSYVQQGKCG